MVVWMDLVAWVDGEVFHPVRVLEEAVRPEHHGEMAWADAV